MYYLHVYSEKKCVRTGEYSIYPEELFTLNQLSTRPSAVGSLACANSKTWIVALNLVRTKCFWLLYLACALCSVALWFTRYIVRYCICLFSLLCALIVYMQTVPVSCTCGAQVIYFDVIRTNAYLTPDILEVLFNTRVAYSSQAPGTPPCTMWPWKTLCGDVEQCSTPLGVPIWEVVDTSWGLVHYYIVQCLHKNVRSTATFVQGGGVPATCASILYIPWYVLLLLYL